MHKLLTLEGETAEKWILTSEISSSGCINLLVALLVVRVAGLLVTAAGGLDTVLPEPEPAAGALDWV